jgi:hypothetical protein
MFVFHTKPCLSNIGYHIFFLFSLEVKHKQMSQTTAESSGEREVVVGDWDNWIFCYCDYYTLS